MIYITYKRLSFLPAIMEFDQLLASVQSFLTSIAKPNDSFKHIKHFGGNEEILKRITDSLKSLLQPLYAGDVPDENAEDQLRKVLFYLMLNTDFKVDILEFTSTYANIVNTCPKLNVFLLSYVAFTLKLDKWYYECVYNLHSSLSVELLDTSVIIVQKLKPEDVLSKTCLLVKAAYEKLCFLRENNDSVNFEERSPEILTGFLRAVLELLKNFLSPEMNQMKDWRPKTMYRYMGEVIMKLFDLIYCCFELFLKRKEVGSMFNSFYGNSTRSAQHTNPTKANSCSTRMDISLERINQCLLSCGDANFKAITLEIFLFWAEYKAPNSKLTMQNVIAGKAYALIELLQNYKEAEEFCKMLKTIASKPHSLEKQILDADPEDIIQNIKNCPICEDRQKWIKAFIDVGSYKQNPDHLNTLRQLCKDQYLTSEDIMYYVKKNSHDIIAGKTELKYFISSIIETNECSFSIEEIMKIAAFFLQNCGFETPLLDNDINAISLKIQQFFNKIGGDSIKIDLKLFVLLIIQHSAKATRALLEECVKTNATLMQFSSVFVDLKKVFETEEYEETLLWKCYKDFFQETFMDREASLHSALLKSIFEADINKFDCRRVVVEIMLSLMQVDNKREELKKLLLILKDIINDYRIQNALNLDILMFIGKVLIENRSEFSNFDNKKHELAEISAEIVEIFVDRLYETCQDFQTVSRNIRNFAETMKKYDRFYFRSLWSMDIDQDNQQDSFLRYVLPKSVKIVNDVENESLVCKLLSLLPVCLPQEWLWTTQSLRVGTESPLQALAILVTVCMILCDMTKAPEQMEGLRYCLRQFGVVVKNEIIPYLTNEDEEDRFAELLLRILKQLPSEIDENEDGIVLVCLFDKKLLSRLSNNKNFALRMTTFSHKNVCKVLCRRMLED